MAGDLGGLGGFFPPSEHPLHWPEGPWMAGPDSQVHRSRGGGGGQVKVSQIHHLHDLAKCILALPGPQFPPCRQS